jgi:hypothetical protein
MFLALRVQRVLRLFFIVESDGGMMMALTARGCDHVLDQARGKRA